MYKTVFDTWDGSCKKMWWWGSKSQPTHFDQIKEKLIDMRPCLFTKENGRVSGYHKDNISLAFIIEQFRHATLHTV
jgi:hypothetical protein